MLRFKKDITIIDFLKFVKKYLNNIKQISKKSKTSSLQRKKLAIQIYNTQKVIVRIKSRKKSRII